MKVKKIKVYDKDPDSGVDNEYPTNDLSFRQPALHMIVGVRNSGKSFSASKILAQEMKNKTFDVVYMITPSFNSNRAYFGRYVKPENVYEPTKESISLVIQRVETDRDEWEQYLEELAMYHQFKKDMKKKSIEDIDEGLMLLYYENGFFNKKPQWKYEKEEPPKSLLILDDCLGSDAILQSSGLTKIATLNRHIAPLKEDYKGRSACGLAVMMLSQSYRMSNGISRVLRENLSLITLFKNKQEKQIDAIREELANVVDIDLFNKAYEYATSERYGNLTVDFKPKHPALTFRKNLNEAIIFDELNREIK